ncbi:MAG TPA: exo-alpha-sialidase, partial [Streptosporangiaceae bacterium]|nr:exo-alpha-sialidase [Streptosporangiaceae bacterium]
GAFRSDDGGKSWQPINRGLRSEGIPDEDAEVGHCVHRLARHAARPDVLFMQKHWDVMRSDNAGDSWQEVSGDLPTDFGFTIGVHAHEPDTVFVVPITSDSLHYPPDGRLRVYRSRSGGNEWVPLADGLPQRDCYVNVLRDAMAIDSLDDCGVYFGTTGGQVYASADAGDSWAPIVHDLPRVLSVEVQTLP